MQTNQELIKSLEDAIQQAQQTLAELKDKQQSLATTMDEVVNELKPIQYISNLRNLKQGDEQECFYSLTAAAAEKVQAYTDVLNLCHYLNGKFNRDEESKYYFITNNFNILYNSNGVSIAPIYHFTSRTAAEYALTHFKGVFEKFYQTL